MSCDALNCGQRQFLHDDLQAVTLSPDTITCAVQLWPTVEKRVGLPADLEGVVEELSRVSLGSI